jgi:inosine-uridine nucleoside N-ribohydrolase
VIRRAIIVLVVLTGLIATTLAFPVLSWRTGRTDVPELDLIAGGPPVNVSKRIWIDTDAACGSTPRTDPDDCLAIAWLAGRDNLTIAGISTSYGNAEADTVTSTVHQLVTAIAKAGYPVPRVWSGAPAARASAQTDTTPTKTGLQLALEQGPLTILALGPLTNIDAALNGRPDLQRRVVRLIAVMGHRPGHIFHPSEGSGQGTLFGHGPIFRDLNFAMDPDAASSILGMQLPITLIPYDAARTVHITANDLERMKRQDLVLGWAAQRSRDWLTHWRETIGQPGFYPFDWVAAAYLAMPDEFHCAEATARIATEWALWLVPRRSLLIGPYAGSQARRGRVVYCPKTERSLHELLVPQM